MNYIKGFDGLRAMSVLMVVLTHLGIREMLPDTPFIKDRLFELFAGVTGVNIFFAISGFLITRILLREKSQTGKISFKNFYARRFLRLLPPLLVFYAIILLMMNFGWLKSSLSSVLLSFFYLYNYCPYSIYNSLIGHTWSLAVEEQFYFIWPFIVAYVSLKKLLRIIALIIAASLCIFYFITYLAIEYNGVTYTLNSWSWAHRWFIPAVGPIMIGAGVSVIIFYNLYSFKKWLVVRQTPWISLILFCCPVYLPSFLFSAFPLIQAAGVSVFLAWIYHHQQSGITHVLEWKPLSFIGKLSYGIYVYQGIFLGTGPRGKNLWIQQFPQNVCLTLALALLSFYLLEKPMLRLKRHFISTQHSENMATVKVVA